MKNIYHLWYVRWWYHNNMCITYYVRTRERVARYHTYHIIRLLSFLNFISYIHIHTIHIYTYSIIIIRIRMYHDVIFVGCIEQRKKGAGHTRLFWKQKKVRRTGDRSEFPNQQTKILRKISNFISTLPKDWCPFKWNFIYVRIATSKNLHEYILTFDLILDQSRAPRKYGRSHWNRQKQIPQAPQIHRCWFSNQRKK